MICRSRFVRTIYVITTTLVTTVPTVPHPNSKYLLVAKFTKTKTKKKQSKKQSLNKGIKLKKIKQI